MTSPLSQVGQVCIVSVLLCWRQQNGCWVLRSKQFSPSRYEPAHQPASRRCVHSAHLPSPDLTLLEGVCFCVLSPALVPTFRKVSQPAGSIFWAFLLLAYPISTAEVPQGTGLQADSCSCAPQPSSIAMPSL